MYTHSSFGCISKHLKLDIPSASMNLFCLDYFGYFRKYRRFVGVNIKHTRKSSEGYTDGVMDRQENISVLNLRNFTTCKNHVSEDESSHEKINVAILFDIARNLYSLKTRGKHIVVHRKNNQSSKRTHKRNFSVRKYFEFLNNGEDYCNLQLFHHLHRIYCCYNDLKN